MARKRTKSVTGNSESAFEIIIDTREQRPYSFNGLRADAADGGAEIKVRTSRGTLESGDYSLAGYTGDIAIERKSIEDLYCTIGQGRERFERELIRLSRFHFAAVVVESDWDTILTYPPDYTRLPPKTIFRSVIAWQIRYPVIHWVMAGSRKLAQIYTYRLLERYWKEEHDRKEATGGKGDTGPVPACAEAAAAVDPAAVAATQAD